MMFSATTIPDSILAPAFFRAGFNQNFQINSRTKKEREKTPSKRHKNSFTQKGDFHPIKPF